MKKTWIPLASALTFAAACGTSPTGSPESTPSAPMLSEQKVQLSSKANIDSMVVHIDGGIGAGQVKKFSPNIYNKKDAIAFVESEGQLRRLTTSLYKEKQEDRDYYYLENGKVIFLKHLEWIFEGNPPGAREFVCYFMDNGEVAALERKVVLAPNERPARLMGEPQKAVVLNTDSLARAVQANFEAMKTAAEKSLLNGKAE